MGVPGLWEIINKVGASRSLAHVAIKDGFEANPSGHRGYRLGIDANIWLTHAKSSKDGENPAVRMLFFRILGLLEFPILPLFVFDGRNRPKLKRGSRMGKSGSHPHTKEFKQFLEALGVEWREAPGEAEAELAHLNQLGYIDGIMSDDCDSLVFGAQVLLKNKSTKLSGNYSAPALNAAGRTDKQHTMVYSAHDLETHPEVGLKRGGLILIALIAGGDYEDGVKGLGPTFAHGLARCGFGEELLAEYNSKTEQEFRLFLPQWRQRMCDELSTNSRGYLTSRKHNFALPNDFPSLATLKNYARPITSGARASPMRDKGELDLAALASLCEDYFEWATAEGIVNRFRNLVWKVAIMHVFRRSALEADRRQKEGRTGSNAGFAIGSPASLIAAHLGPQKKKKVGKNARLDALSDVFVNQGTAPVEDTPRRYDPSIPDTHPLVTGITLSRCHTSTDGLREYRLQYSPIQFVTLTRSGIRKFRPQPETKREPKEAPNPKSSDLLWVSEIVLSKVHPELVTTYLEKEAERGRKKPGRPRKKNQDRDSSPVDMDAEMDVEEPQPASGSQSRLLAQLDAIAAPKAKKAQRKPRRPKGSQQPPSSPIQPRELPLSPIQSQQLPMPPTQARNSSPVRPQDPPNPMRQFLFTFVDPGIDYDDEDVEDPFDSSAPPTPPPTQESLLLSQPDDFAGERSTVRATARVTAILDSIMDQPWDQSKGKGKRKAVGSADAAKRPAKKTKAFEAMPSVNLPATPPSSQQTRHVASSSVIGRRAKQQHGDDSSEIEILSPRGTAGKHTQTLTKRKETGVPEKVDHGANVPRFRYGDVLPDLDDSDDSDLELNFPPPLSQTSARRTPLASNEVIDLT
ncbi:hypothetical protein BKA70DRAFT_1519374 [Coprinopsis sp. MPI-PUGE-AT-0042]|nr:hypothetical protein BKA70DRAFT_1519374 [Coprinopsis sp. MPI-PUGE-AT-0042]